MGIPTPHHRETIDHLLHQPISTYDPKIRQCGCIQAKDGDWMLCAYHDGYDEGIDLIRAQMEQAAKRAKQTNWAGEPAEVKRTIDDIDWKFVRDWIAGFTPDELRELGAALAGSRSVYDEDGYCLWCGNGHWKHHAPYCVWALVHD